MRNDEKYKSIHPTRLRMIENKAREYEKQNGARQVSFPSAHRV
jgi:hypothetical protein